MSILRRIFFGEAAPPGPSDRGWVFLNYAHADRALVEQMAQAFTAARIRLWTDQSIAPGQNFSKAIEDAIEGAALVTTLWTPNSAQSNYVRADLNFVSERKLPHLLILANARRSTASARRANRAASEREAVLEQEAVLQQEEAEHSDEASAALPRFIASGPVVHLSDGGWQNVAERTRQILREIDPALLDAVVIQPREKTNPQLNLGGAFLSYSGKDEPEKEEVVAFLDSRRYGYWGFGDSDRAFDLSLFKEIEGQIDASRLVILIQTDNSMESRWCLKEYDYATQIGKEVFILRFSGRTRLATADAPFIDFRADRSRGFRQLDRELKKRGLLQREG